MAQAGVPLFDKTVNETHHWLREISEQMNHPDQQMAYHALRGVLTSLRDRLPADSAADLAAQLPTLVRGVYYEGYHPAGKPDKGEDLDEFLRRVGEPYSPYCSTTSAKAKPAKSAANCPSNCNHCGCIRRLAGLVSRSWHVGARR